MKLLLLSGVVAGFLLLGTKCEDKIRDCPEEWIVNQMPTVAESPATGQQLPSEYFIYQGVRRELAEFDTTWIRKNCPNLSPQVVH